VKGLRVAVETDRNGLGSELRFRVQGGVDVSERFEEELVVREGMLALEAHEAFGMEAFVEGGDEVVRDGEFAGEALRSMEADVALFAVREAVEEHERFGLVGRRRRRGGGDVVGAMRDPRPLLQALRVDKRVPAFRTKQVQLVVVSWPVLDARVV